MEKFTYVVIPEKQYNQMLSMETDFDMNSSRSNTYVDKFICDREVDYIPSYQISSFSNYTPILSNSDEKILKAYSKSKLDAGLQYDIICFPKTCSSGIAFVK